MSEAAGAHTTNINSAFRLESVGRTLPGMKTMLFEQDVKKNGEVLILTITIHFMSVHTPI
jgi:long-subunit acyl-CoA synthetase (AMP-forming)